ncbi:unnamed protein product [Pleuronectes platessa]|uniref:Uncharacterized protein n=1 Tax=Pleuronectes platessa TaxID=8262 RepID=A0A9N7VRY1_PLEPL|nr:unnamed protein product [Pleuronectes platessa]
MSAKASFRLGNDSTPGNSNRTPKESFEKKHYCKKNASTCFLKTAAGLPPLSVHRREEPHLPGVQVNAGDVYLTTCGRQKRTHGIPACSRRPSREPAAGSELLQRRAGSS